MCAGHSHRCVGKRAERLEVDLQLLLARGDGGQAMVAVDDRAAMAGHVLDDTDDSRRRQPLQQSRGPSPPTRIGSPP